MKISFKIICILVSVVVATSLIIALTVYLIPENIKVSVSIIGENESVLFEEKDINILYRGKSSLKLNEAIVQVLSKNNIDFILDNENETIVKMFGLEEYVEDEVYGDSGAYWRMYVNSEPISDRPSKLEIKNGDNIMIEWCLYDRHQYCDYD